MPRSSLWAPSPIVDMFVTNPNVLVISYVCDALMTTGLDLVLMLAIIDIAGRQQTARYTAIATTLGGLRGIVAPLVGAAIIEYAGVRAVYAVAAAVMISGGLVVLCSCGRAPFPPCRGHAARPGRPCASTFHGQVERVERLS